MGKVRDQLQRQIGRWRRITRAGAARNVTASLAILVVVSGVLGAIRYGGICTLTAEQVFAACPLGFLERSLASASLLPTLWLPVGLAVLSIVALGRVFCAWVCPAGLVRRLFGIRPSLPSTRRAPPGVSIGSPYSSYAVLGGVLVASFLFRFPVFCFFCPVGLFYAAIFAVLKVSTPDALSVELFLFPLMLGVELWALKSWCRSLCPLGALLSIVGNLNHVLVPAVNTEKCRRSQGIQCGACERACPEGIDLMQKSKFVPNSCTKCLECTDKCPVKAIEIRLFA